MEPEPEVEPEKKKSSGTNLKLKKVILRFRLTERRLVTISRCALGWAASPAASWPRPRSDPALPPPSATAPTPADTAALASAADPGMSETKLEEWRKRGGGALDPVLASGAVALLDAQWVINHAEAGGVLIHRQALPKEAFLSLADLVEATLMDDLPVAAALLPVADQGPPRPARSQPLPRRKGAQGPAH